MIAKENVENRRLLREEGVIPSLLALWQRNVKARAHLRSEAIFALHNIAIASQDNKV